MKRYETNQTVRLPAGTVLALSPEQIRRRRHLLEPVADGMTVARQPVEFKAGEIIGLDPVPLALAAVLAPVERDDQEDLSADQSPSAGESTQEESKEASQPEAIKDEDKPETKPADKSKGKSK
jgi:hypothetical protein